MHVVHLESHMPKPSAMQLYQLLSQLGKHTLSGVILPVQGTIQ